MRNVAETMAATTVRSSFLEPYSWSMKSTIEVRKILRTRSSTSQKRKLAE